MDIIPSTMSKKDLKAEVMDRNYKAGYTTRDGHSRQRTKIMNYPADEKYRDNYDRIFGERKLNVWPRDSKGNLID